MNAWKDLGFILRSAVDQTEIKGGFYAQLTWKWKTLEMHTARSFRFKPADCRCDVPYSLVSHWLHFEIFFSIFIWSGENKNIWKGTINAERYIQVLEQHMLPSRHRLFQGRPCIFQHDNARPHTASITTLWLRRRRIRVLKWPACSPDLSHIENIWRIIKRKMRQRRPKTVEQLEACIRQEWDNIPIPKLEQLVSSVPRRLQTVIKRRGDATQW